MIRSAMKKSIMITRERAKKSSQCGSRLISNVHWSVKHQHTGGSHFDSMMTGRMPCYGFRSEKRTSFSADNQSNHSSHFKDYSVKKLLNLHNDNSSFAYRQSVNICQWIEEKLNQVIKQQTIRHEVDQSSSQVLDLTPLKYFASSVQQIQDLTSAIHLSNYNAWKPLKILSIAFEKFLESEKTKKCILKISASNSISKTNDTNIKMPQTLCSILRILHNLNYQLSERNDSTFIQTVKGASLMFHHKRQGVEAKQHFSYFVDSADERQGIRDFKKQEALLRELEILSGQEVFLRELLDHEDFSQHVEEKLIMGTIESISRNIRQLGGSQESNSAFKLLKSIETIVKNGLYGNLWMEPFYSNLVKALQELIEKSNDRKSQDFSGERSSRRFKSIASSILNAIKLSLHESYPVQIWESQKPQKNKQKSKEIIRLRQTQVKISTLLEELGYEVDFNQKLFNYEIDYRFLSMKVIVEFHGIHHYRINESKPVFDVKSRWKANCFARRGYNLIVIPFYEWKQLDTVYDKKRYLIEKVEKSILKSSLIN